MSGCLNSILFICRFSSTESAPMRASYANGSSLHARRDRVGAVVEGAAELWVGEVPVGLGALEGARHHAVGVVVGRVGVALLARDGVVADGVVVGAVRRVGVAAHPAVGRPVVALVPHRTDVPLGVQVHRAEAAALQGSFGTLLQPGGGIQPKVASELFENQLYYETSWAKLGS